MNRHRIGLIAGPIIFSLVLLSQVSAQQLVGFRWLTDYSRAHQIRVTKNRPMLVFVTMKGCHFCDRMLETTYTDATVVSQINNGFVPTKIDGVRQQSLARQFGVRIFPTTFLISADNRVTDRIEGYMSPDVFRQRIAAAQPATVGR